jgi:SPP1 gp7 family putative phage head morphogenesis protein
MPNAQYSSTMIPFEEAIAYHLQKLQLPSESWRDLQGSIHARAFTVAGATNLALLNDLHQAVTAAISNGDTLQDFRKKFDTAVAKYGWSYKGKRGWRTNVIYQNNKNTANAAGRWTQQQRVKGTRPYLLYSTAADTRVRPDHQRWHYYLLPVDHPFWHSHYPPNGWNCRCKVISLSERDIKRMNLKITEPGSVDLRKISQTDTVTGEVIEKFPGLDLGWDYNPGMAWVAPDIALGRELVKLPPVVRKASISAVNTKLQEQVASYRAWLANMSAQTPEYAARSRFVAGHIPPEAISALYKANVAVPNSVVLVSGAIAAQLSATMPNAMQDLMTLLANADQAQYDSGADVLTVQSGERKLRLVWIAGLLQLLGLL